MTNTFSYSLRAFNRAKTVHNKVKKQKVSKEKKNLLQQYKEITGLTRLPYGFGKKDINFIKSRIEEEKSNTISDNEIMKEIKQVNYDLLSEEKIKKINESLNTAKYEINYGVEEIKIKKFYERLVKKFNNETLKLTLKKFGSIKNYIDISVKNDIIKLKKDTKDAEKYDIEKRKRLEKNNNKNNKNEEKQVTKKTEKNINYIYNNTIESNNNYRIKYNYTNLIIEEKVSYIKQLFKEQKITENRKHKYIKFIREKKDNLENEENCNTKELILKNFWNINVNNINTYNDPFNKIFLLKYDLNTIIEYVVYQNYTPDMYFLSIGDMKENKKKKHFSYGINNEKTNMKHIHRSSAVRFFLQYTYSTDLLNIELSTETETKTFSPMRDGSTNCVIQCLKDLDIKFPKRNDFDTLNNKYYDSGVDEEQMKQIAKTLKIKIKLYVYNTIFLFGNQNRNQKTIELYNKNEHCTIKPIEKSKTVYLDVDNLESKMQEFDHKCVLNFYKDDNDNIISLEVKEGNNIDSTKSILYIVKYNNGVDLEEHKCLSDIQYYNNLFFEQNKKLDTIKYTHENFNIIKKYPNNCIYYSHNRAVFNEETLTYEDSNTYKTIDLITAFNNFAKFSNYTGFPKNLNIALKPEALTDEVLYNYEGIAYVEYIDILTNRFIKHLISFPFIRFLKEENIEYKIIYVLMSNEVLKLDTFAFDTLDKRCLQKVFGCLMKTTKSYTFCTTDKQVARSYGSCSETKWDWSNDENLYQCKDFYEDKQLNRYAPHIVGYVKDYVNIQILKQVLILQQNNISIKRIWVDGIDIDTKENIKGLYDKSIFKVKSSKVHDTYNLNIESLILEDEPKNLYDSFNRFKLNNNITLITGAPGTGKSHNIKQLYNQNSKCLILTPTHILKKMYANYDVQTFQSTIKKPLINGYSHVFIDEYTMISQKLFNDFRTKLEEDTKIILVGDKNQLSLDFGDPIKITDDIEVITLTKNYRQLDSYFEQMIAHTLETGNINWIKQTITEEEAVQKPNSIILSATNDEIERLNMLGHKLNKNKQVKNCKINTPIRFLTKTKNHCKNDLGICIELHDDYFMCKLNGETELFKVKYDSDSWMYAYSITYHCVQGLTIKDTNIILNQKKLFDKKRMLYVGTSRASDITQLYKMKFT